MPDPFQVVVFGGGFGGPAAVSRDRGNRSRNCRRMAFFEAGCLQASNRIGVRASWVHAASTESPQLLSPHGFLTLTHRPPTPLLIRLLDVAGHLAVLI